MMQNALQNFFADSQQPLAVVSTIPPKDRETVIDFLLRLNVPVYLEGISGIREDARLDHLKVTFIQKLWKISKEAGYEIDGILRIGGMPTFRPWRDLEDKQGNLSVCSISHLPFSGLSWGEVLHTDLSALGGASLPRFSQDMFDHWLEEDRKYRDALDKLIEEEPKAEQSIFRALSNAIPEESLVYLGNSLPIREWDLAATWKDRELKVFATRGLNGIDGQVSTFLGMARPGGSNWGIFGDLTMMYDLVGPWILRQLENTNINIVVINNGGGMIFSRMFPHQEFLNSHPHHFEHIAKHWGLDYYRGDRLPAESKTSRLIELIPNHASTSRFTEKYNTLRIPAPIG